MKSAFSNQQHHISFWNGKRLFYTKEQAHVFGWQMLDLYFSVTFNTFKMGCLWNVNLTVIRIMTLFTWDFAIIIHFSVFPVLITVLGSDVLHLFFYLLVSLAVRWRALYNLLWPLSVHMPVAGTPLLQMSSAAPPSARKCRVTHGLNGDFGGGGGRPPSQTPNRPVANTWITSSIFNMVWVLLICESVKYNNSKQFCSDLF